MEVGLLNLWIANCHICGGQIATFVEGRLPHLWRADCHFLEHRLPHLCIATFGRQIVTFIKGKLLSIFVEDCLPYFCDARQYKSINFVFVTMTVCFKIGQSVRSRGRESIIGDLWI